MAKIDWSTLVKKEDWWAVWVGFFIILGGLLGAAMLDWKLDVKDGRIVRGYNAIFSWVPASVLPSWGYDIVKGRDLGWPIKFDPHGISIIYVFIFTLIVTWVAVTVIDRKFKPSYIAGYAIVFMLALLAILIGRQATIHAYGLEFPLWALLLGLLISNTIGVPKWMRPAVRTELFIKIGLVILGAEILFTDILAAGTYGVVQALLVVFAVWYFAYFLGIKVGLSKSFSAIIATGVSICGVSAAIAAGGATKGDPKEVSYVISWVLVCAVPMLVAEPYIAMALFPDPKVAAYVGGAWIGGTIDTTPAVVAAGAFLGDVGLKVAAIVKMSQNVLIGVVAFLLAAYWTLRVERKPEERPSPMEIWYRFPKFIVGFLIASIIITSLVYVVGAPKAAALGLRPELTTWSEVIKRTAVGFFSPLRSAWFFPMAFVCIGLDTRIAELVKLGGGKPAAVFIIAQLFNIVFTLIIAYILWSGVWLPVPAL